MKKSTKSSLIIFIVVFIVGYVMACFIPDELLMYTTINGSILSFLGSEIVKITGMRTIIALAIALVAVLLIRIVDTEEKTEKNKNAKKNEKKETK